MSYQHIGPKQESAGRTGLRGRNTMHIGLEVNLYSTGSLDRFASQIIPQHPEFLVISSVFYEVISVVLPGDLVISI